MSEPSLGKWQFSLARLFCIATVCSVCGALWFKLGAWSLGWARIVELVYDVGPLPLLAAIIATAFALLVALLPRSDPRSAGALVFASLLAWSAAELTAFRIR